MTCSEFLQAYSELRDGVIRDPALAAALEAHRGECLRCRRLAHAMTQGLALLHHLAGDVEPSPRFRSRLHQRLRAEVIVGDPVVPTHGGLAAALLLAAALGLLVFESVTGRRGTERVAQADTAVTFEPALSNVTLPAFTHSTLEFHGAHAPLGSPVVFTVIR
jgi:hypothetical protein